MGPKDTNVMIGELYIKYLFDRSDSPIMIRIIHQSRGAVFIIRLAVANMNP